MRTLLFNLRISGTHGLRDCVASQGHPFHGECPIAVCCQAKGLAHCGKCEIFPCGLLRQYSEDPVHGDDPPGARIAVCRKWADAD